jgi:TonB family protein
MIKQFHRRFSLSFFEMFYILVFKFCMKHLIITSLLVCLHYLLIAQNKEPKIVGYFDAAWLKVTDKEEAVYYRTTEKMGGGKYLVKDYYMSGQLQMNPVICTDYYPRIRWEGVTKLYHENGKVKEEGLFKNELRMGLHTFWHTNGAPHKIVWYEENKPKKYMQYRSETGDELLTAGGNATIQEQGGGTDYYIQLIDSVHIASFIMDSTPSDTIYLMVEKEPQYAGGLEMMYKKIAANLKYPAVARRQNIEGIVYISFIVDEKGKAIDHQVIRGISKECDEGALRVTTLLTNWSPGMNRGKLVKVKFILPIVYDLR